MQLAQNSPVRWLDDAPVTHVSGTPVSGGQLGAVEASASVGVGLFTLIVIAGIAYLAYKYL